MVRGVALTSIISYQGDARALVTNGPLTWGSLEMAEPCGYRSQYITPINGVKTILNGQKRVSLGFLSPLSMEMKENTTDQVIQSKWPFHPRSLEVTIQPLKRVTWTHHPKGRSRRKTHQAIRWFHAEKVTWSRGPLLIPGDRANPGIHPNKIYSIGMDFLILR